MRIGGVALSHRMPISGWEKIPKCLASTHWGPLGLIPGSASSKTWRHRALPANSFSFYDPILTVRVFLFVLTPHDTFTTQPITEIVMGINFCLYLLTFSTHFHKILCLPLR